MPDQGELHGRSIPEAILKRILAPVPDGAVVPLRAGKLWLPPSHPAYGLKAGGSRVVGGATVQYRPSEQSRKVLIAGIPERYSQGLDLASELPAKKKATKSPEMKLIAAMSDYFGEDLPPGKRDRLKAVYRDSLEQASQLRTRLSQDQVAMPAAKEGLAGILSNAVLDEMKVFAGEAKAQARRYRKWRGDAPPDGQLVRELLHAAFRELLEGEYLKRDAKVVAEEQETMRSNSAVATKALFDKNMTKNSFSANKAAYLLPVGEYEIMPSATIVRPTVKVEPGITKYIPQGPREIYGWEARIYTAEHSVLPDALTNALSQLFGEVLSDFGLVHTSVIAGIWRLTKQKFLKQSVIHNPATGTDVNVGAPTKITRFWDEWYEWSVANGCASWLRTEDELILKWSGVFPSYDAAIKALKTSTPTSGGKYYKIRACAYSVGNWPLNWLCHQNANAFSVRKWGINLVFYPTIYIWGMHGNFWNKLAGGSYPISTREDPIYHTYPYFGGVPGQWLHYQYTPPYASLLALLIPFMDGGGYGLDIRWNPNTNEWNWMEASYTSRAIPFEGPSFSYAISGGW